MSLLRREYLSSAVSMSTNSRNILHIAKGDFFQLNYFHSDQQIGERCCRSDFNSVLPRLPCYFSRDLLKRDFLDIYLTTFFEVRKFKSKSARTVILFLKMLKIECKFQKCNKKLKKHFLFVRKLHLTMLQ